MSAVPDPLRFPSVIMEQPEASPELLDVLSLDPDAILRPIPPELYVLPGIPAEAYTLVAGALSSYKSTLLAYLIVWKATGWDLLGMDPSAHGTEPGPAVLVFYEDSDTRVLAKLHRVLQHGHATILRGYGAADAAEFLARASANIKRIPLTGQAGKTLVYRHDGMILPNEPVIASLLASIRSFASAGVLIGIDPLRLAITGSQNDDDGADVVVHTLNRIAAAIPGSGVVVCSHTTKAGAIEPGDGYASAAYATSGSALYSQHARSNFHMTRLKAKEIRELFGDEVPEDEIDRQPVAQLTHGRLSHGVESARTYVRMKDGVLLPLQPRAARSADEVMRTALPVVVAAIKRLKASGTRASETAISMDEAVQRAMGGGKHRVRELLRLIEENGYVAFTGNTRGRDGEVTEKGRLAVRTNADEWSGVDP